MNLGVCAVVVTYFPDADDLDNLASVWEQAQDVVVVDNGSTEDILISLRELASKLNIHLLENGDNLGIASALNTGARWAIENSYKWVTFFDQDSRPMPGCVEALLKTVTKHPSAENIALVMPSLIDSQTRLPLKGVRKIRGEFSAAQTSGSLMQTRVFEEEGWFDESFFMDCVDYDYCLRIRARGWLIVESAQGILMHRPTDPKLFSLFNIRLFGTTNYEPIRRYYRTRNIIWMLRRHHSNYLLFCLKLNYENAKDIAKVLVEDKKIPKLMSALRGCIDGFTTDPNRRVVNKR